MAKTIDDLYSQTVYPWYTIKRWALKSEIQQEFDNSLEIADIVFVEYKASKYTFKQIDEYLLSLGCSRTKNIDSATKILCNWGSYYDSTFNIFATFEKKPTEIPDKVTLRHKCVKWSSVEGSIVDFFDKQRPRIEFDYAQYENLWNLYESNIVDNYRVAAMGIMTIDWTDQMFLLHMLIYQFQGKIRLSNYSQIPGWSAWANNIGVSWKKHLVYAYQLIWLFKNYEITDRQITLIHKLLNNK